MQLAPSAFLASAAACSVLVHQIVPAHLQDTPILHQSDALAKWSHGHDLSPPDGLAQQKQRVWDTLKVSVTVNTLFEAASDEKSRARLLAASSKESGAWLHAFPVSSLGLRMDNNTVRVAVGLRLGAAICHPHTCCHCGVEVDHLATHGLNCRKSEGRHFRHAALNDIVHRALSSANIPSRLEPVGISCSTGKRPDGVSLVPWERGRLLVWDATCSDTYAPSYITSAASEAGIVASQAEERKIRKYDHLDDSLQFTPVAVETTGVFGPRTKSFF